MNQVKAGKILLASVGLLSHLGQYTHAESSETIEAGQGQRTSETEAQQDQLQERLTIEGQWIKVPGHCKDRSISSDPQVIESEPLSAVMTAIHSLVVGN